MMCKPVGHHRDEPLCDNCLYQDICNERDVLCEYYCPVDDGMGDDYYEGCWKREYIAEWNDYTECNIENFF